MPPDDNGGPPALDPTRIDRPTKGIHMTWESARSLLRFPSRTGTRGDGPQRMSGVDGRPPAASLCVASGKGGTGKSIVSASLGRCFANAGRTLILDADMGIGNAHILHGLSPDRSFVELVRGDISIHEVISSCGGGLDLIAAGSGVSRMAGLTPPEIGLIANGLAELESEYDQLIVDSAAGISDQTLHLAAACDEVLVVTTPDLTAMTDAYAFLKVLWRARPDIAPRLVVNRADDMEQARGVARRIDGVCRKFLGRTPRWTGWIPDDRAVSECVNARAPVVLHRPESPAGRALEALADVMLGELRRSRHCGLGRTLARHIGPLAASS